MRHLPAVVLLLAASPALANPMLTKCLSLAPQICGLDEKSPADAYLSCFANAGDPKSEAGKAEAACAEELAHARVHKSCDAKDIPAVCAGVKPGNDRMMTCLRKNKAKLGPDCGKALESYDAVAAPAEPVTKGKTKARRSKGSAVSAVRC